MDDHARIFDRVLVALGFQSGAELARALGRNRQSASSWRRAGFPKARRWDLQELARERGAVLPPEFFTPDNDLSKRPDALSVNRAAS